ncbi:MAG: hypothetical protein ABIN04_06830 [Ginsengibacter sp.]
MASRRNFIQQSSLAGIAIGIQGKFPFLNSGNKIFSFESPYFKLKLTRERPEFSFFSTDSLGGGQFSVSPILNNEEKPGLPYESRLTSKRISYYHKERKKDPPIWEFKMHPKSFSIRTRWSGNEKITPLSMSFAQKINHCTVLGNMPGKNQMKFPCLLHFPGMGTFRIYCNDPAVTLFYDADRYVKDPFVKIVLQPADVNHSDITYKFVSVAIYPEIERIKGDNRYDGFRRNYINMFQMNPRIQALANNSASDNCTFTVFLYSEMARQTPELVEGFTAMDMVRNTLDKYFEGMKGYGEVGYPNVDGGWASKFDSLDSAPSLIISACNYVIDSKDLIWANKNYEHIRKWVIKMMATDKNGDGIVEYGYSGNSGSWSGKVQPANWWDNIGFGHDDAYSNALVYRACSLMADLALLLNKPEDREGYLEFAGKLKNNYFDRFYNPDSGVLGGWRSEDGKLHDYYFLFVNSTAICYGLIEDEKAKAIMKRLLQKMKDVGYTDFRLGLPGNLIPVPKEDYTNFNKRFGYDSFQVYENGGATGCYAYFTISALYKLGMQKEANEILMPMLESYKEGRFQGYCPDSNMTKDWKTWKGECWGYEGFLVDNFFVFLALTD